MNLFFTNGQTADPDYLDGVVYMKVGNQTIINLIPYDSTDVDFNQIVSDFEVTEILQPFSGIGSDTLDLTYKLHFDDTMGVNQLVVEINNLSWVDYCEKAPLFKTTYTPNDFNSEQWYLSKIEASEGWDFTQGSSDVTIAIVDNAVRTSHSDLMDNLWVNSDESQNGLDSDLNGYTDDINGYDVADGDNDPNPPSSFSSGAFSHGTHCAGTASGSTDNGNGIAGVGFNCKIMSVKCTRDVGDGTTLQYAYEGLRYAVDANADIISMSWGSRASSFTGDALINTAVIKGITMFAAAGNNGEESLLSPASHGSVMAVGATNQNDEITSFSNYGSDIAFMAPGLSIYNLLGGNDNDYGFSNGTSMSCPMAAGLGGLILSFNPNFTPVDIENAIKDGCDFIDNLNSGYENKLGAGRINIGNTFNILSTQELEKRDIMQYYPNPASERLNIILEEVNINKNDIEIIDNLGRDVTNEIIFEKKALNQFVLGGLSNLETGVYFIRIEKVNKVVRFIVE
jgi:subtilisin family serine protease